MRHLLVDPVAGHHQERGHGQVGVPFQSRPLPRSFAELIYPDRARATPQSCKTKTNNIESLSASAPGLYTCMHVKVCIYVELCIELYIDLR
jgi:hypothetical protein